MRPQRNLTAPPLRHPSHLPPSRTSSLPPSLPDQRFQQLHLACPDTIRQTTRAWSSPRLPVSPSPRAEPTGGPTACMGVGGRGLTGSLRYLTATLCDIDGLDVCGRLRPLPSIPPASCVLRAAACPNLCNRPVVPRLPHDFAGLSPFCSAVIGEIDQDIDADIDLDEVQAAPVPAVVY